MRNPEDDPPGSAYDFLFKLIPERKVMDEIHAAIDKLRTAIEQAVSVFVGEAETILRGDGGATSEQDVVEESDASQSDGTE